MCARVRGLDRRWTDRAFPVRDAESQEVVLDRRPEIFQPAGFFRAALNSQQQRFSTRLMRMASVISWAKTSDRLQLP